jgi:hypothetical protein
MEGTRTRGRTRERWRDEVEEDAKVIGVKNRQAVVRDRR